MFLCRGQYHYEDVEGLKELHHRPVSCPELTGYVWVSLTVRAECWAQLTAVSDEVPPGVPLYDLQSTFPYFYEPRNPAQELLDWKEQNDPAFFENMLLNPAAAEEPAPYPGARQILRWQTNLVCPLSILLAFLLLPLTCHLNA